MKVAILIPTLTERKHLFDALVAKCERLASEVQDVSFSVISLSDSRQMKTGEKRNILMQEALQQGFDYLCFLDDDDDVADDYFAEIAKAVQSLPSVVSFNGWYIQKPKTRKEKEIRKHFIISAEFKKWSETATDYLRFPNHLCVWKTELANKIAFPRKNYGEDYDWAEMMQRHIETSVHIQKDLYLYIK